jgi:hypothetical protein
MTDAAVLASMTDVLSAVAGELGLAQNACARLDDALGDLLSAAPVEQRGAVMRELHAVDLLNQQIAALAGFMTRLSGGVGEAITVEVKDALGAITLGDVARRLGEGLGVGATIDAVSDDVDFF